MAEWPTLDELKQLLDITSEDWDGDSDDSRLTRVLASAIDITKAEVYGEGVNFDDIVVDPTDGMAQAALRMAELLATRPDPSPGRLVLRQDPAFKNALFGSRRAFGIA